ncbi:MAG: hypothetical protein ACRDJN_17910, partial [Chloroflexota bacterium]
ALAGAVPAGVPPEVAAAAQATLGGALVVAEQLPAELGPALAEAAREAFTRGLQLAVGISAILAIGLAILAMVMLRHVRAGAEPERQAPLEPEGGAAGRVGVELDNLNA